MSRLLRLLIVEEIVAGLRERGLPVNSLDDLTGREIELIRQYADMVSGTAARELIDILAVRIRREWGWEK